jgi:molybdate transport system substrate-binding protein
MKMLTAYLLAVLALVGIAKPVTADTVNVAVASNFAPLLSELAARFEQNSEHKIVVIAGATGRLYAQITSGAPFDVFLGADNERSQLLIDNKLALADSRFIFAQGELVLWSPQLNVASNAEQLLKDNQFRHLALANPKLAPFGLAAQQTLEKLQLWQALQAKFVFGENIAQTLQFVESGNAELGFISKAQWLELPEKSRGFVWTVPADFHAPILQEAVILHDSAAARAFTAFMQSEPTKHAIRQAGYLLP